ncbi:MAG: hypothetical protein ACR2H2_14045 [Solirubrobacteraceae bacterium]
MADSPPNPGDDTGAGPGRRSPPRTPRWVKVFAVIALVPVVLVVLMLLIDGDSHGPGRHMGGDTPPASATDGRTPPKAGHR